MRKPTRPIAAGVLLTSLLLAGCMTGSLAPIENDWRTGQGSASRYQVQPGDTLYSVAWAYGLDYRDLAHWNHLSSPYTLQTGQTLRVSGARAGALPERKHFVRQASQAAPSAKARQSAVRGVARQQPENYPAVKRWLMPASGKLAGTFSKAYGGNKGINIAGRYGEPVSATAAGKVVYCGEGLRGYGKLIIIKHNDAYLSAYAFNRVMLVKEGQWVKAGQKIGEMGRDTGGQVRLHFEIRRNGNPVNPLNYVQS